MMLMLVPILPTDGRRGSLLGAQFGFFLKGGLVLVDVFHDYVVRTIVSRLRTTISVEALIFAASHYERSVIDAS